MYALKITLALVLASLAAHTSAMTVADYEKLEAVTHNTGEERHMADMALESYFQGMAETLNFALLGTRRLYFQDKPFLCLPQTAKLTGSMLRGVLDGELRNPNTVLKGVKGDWKSFEVPQAIIPLLARLFPCAP